MQDRMFGLRRKWIDVDVANFIVAKVGDVYIAGWSLRNG